MQPLSLIIPTLNEQDFLPRLLDSFKNQTFAGSYEIIIVDGNSTDNTLKIARQYQKHMGGLKVYRHQRGIARQRNFGALQATYDTLIFIDADMELPPTALAKIGRHLRHGDKNFIATPGLFPYDWKIVDLFYFIISLIFFYRVRKQHPIIAGMCFITSKQIHTRINGFNEAAVVAEDLDYGFRAFRSGARYIMWFDVIIRGSARRLNKMGRLHLGKTWYAWYLHNKKHGPITNKDEYDAYGFGNFKAHK